MSYFISLLQFMIASTFIVGLWVGIDRRTPFDDTTEIMAKHNWPYFIKRLGLLAGHTAGVIACFNFSKSWSSIGAMAAGAAWVTLIVIATYWLAERKLSQPGQMHITNADSIGVGIAKASACLAAGLIANGALTGSAQSPWTAVTATIVFTLLGIVVTVGFCLTAGQAIVRRVRNGETAAGFELASILLAVAIVIRNSTAGDFTGWYQGLAGFAFALSISILLLFVYRMLTGLALRAYNKVESSAAVTALLPIGALLISKLLG